MPILQETYFKTFSCVLTFLCSLEVFLFLLTRNSDNWMQYCKLACSLTTEIFPAYLISVVVFLFGEALPGSKRFIITYVYMECGDMLLLFLEVI